MNRIGVDPRAGLRVVIGFVLILAGSPRVSLGDGWKLGVGRVAITPKEPIWLSGYAARNHPSDGVDQDIWVKALALEDPLGKRAVLVTMDVCGISRDLSARIREAIGRKHGLERDRIVLACSHTHSAPVLGRNLLTMYTLDDAQKQKVGDYTRLFESVVADVVSQAFETLSVARLDWGNGRCDFAVNRRNNPEGEVPALREKGHLKGPDDHDVPVLVGRDVDGRPRAVVFVYACHCTVLDGYKVSGDWAGHAAAALEKRFPGAQAMYVAGCGGDQNPIPRRSEALAETHGQAMAASVAAVLERPMKRIEGPLRSAYREVNLAFGSLPTRSQIESDAKSDNRFAASRARKLLGQIEELGQLPPDYPYPVQAWGLDELRWVFLGGEVTVDYALRIKKEAGSSPTWVSAYCNDVMAYIPSQRVLKEGGYEGGDSMVYYGLPCPWSDRVEESVMSGVNGVLGLIAPASIKGGPSTDVVP
ncbi:neutral/alkaline non-lysosomal ceramidase N-terminal domain-containing protein [Aquisphaera insulae]|uniref:neutral/alkaline non-lysosomal ceramidase N-terminal domain-containing protein n=1 Tax=Aquisphaera insulae TaxID=2712864 RepID=UPI0013EE2F6B|nr:neutral/alkaline non-lysosomal ceramidase N-terminal domain-containing protein [Aquisphaera insulae]